MYYWLHTVFVTVHGFGLFSRVLKCTARFQMKQILKGCSANSNVLLIVKGKVNSEPLCLDDFRINSNYSVAR